MTLDEIAARADAATEGPWEATPNDRIVSSTRTWPEGDPYDVAGMFGHKGAVVEGCRTPDAEFIAHAREDVPRLVAALRAVEAVVSERYKLWAAICGETCGKEVYGIDHDAIADSIAAAIETAIREALGS